MTPRGRGTPLELRMKKGEKGGRRAFGVELDGVEGIGSCFHRGNVGHACIVDAGSRDTKE